jgi:dihydroflavonol-4-reductase
VVTGSSGYLAGFFMIQLLAAGRTVRTTIRDLARADEVRAALRARR